MDVIPLRAESVEMTPVRMRGARIRGRTTRTIFVRMVTDPEDSVPGCPSSMWGGALNPIEHAADA